MTSHKSHQQKSIKSSTNQKYGYSDFFPVQRKNFLLNFFLKFYIGLLVKKLTWETYKALINVKQAGLKKTLSYLGEFASWNLS